MNLKEEYAKSQMKKSFDEIMRASIATSEINLRLTYYLTFKVVMQPKQ